MASPVLKEFLVFKVNDNFNGILDKDDLDVVFTMQGNDTSTRRLNVVSVNNTANTITVKYGGAYSGYYDITVTSATYGNFNTTGQVF